MESKKVSLKVNIFYQIIYQILTLIVPLITAPYIARVLGKNGLGTYSYTYAITNYFVLFAMLGLLNHGNREIASNKQNKRKYSQIFWDIFAVHFFVSIVVLLIYFIVVFFTFHEYKRIALIQSLFIISAVFDISWLYFGLEKFKMTTLVSCINKVLTTGLIFLLVKQKDDVYIYTAIIAGGALFNNIVYWAYLKKNVIFCKPKFSSALKQVKPLIILFIPVIAVSIYKYMDKIMLGAMMTTADVGIYEAAEKFINLPMCVISAFGTVMLPRITNMQANEEGRKIKQYNYISMILVLFVSFGMAFGLAGITKVFIPWFYGEEFTGACSVLLILLPSIVFVSWANVIRTQYLLPNNKDKFYCVSVVAGAVMNLIVNALLIPTKGISGAAIGTTSAEAFVCLLQTFASKKEMDIKLYFYDGIPFFLAGMFMMIIIYNIQFGGAFFTVISRIVIGVIIYSMFSIVFLKKYIKKFNNLKI